jgi:hypothetical protein
MHVERRYLSPRDAARGKAGVIVSKATSRSLIRVFLVLAAGAISAGAGGDRGDPPFGTKAGSPNRSIVLDGSCITSAGNLQINVTNFGFLGSMPRSAYGMADSPSAQWPAGSGIEYLYAAGLWIGAEVEGVPSVSTGYPENEFYPGDDPRDIVYRTLEGATGGRTYPGDADDDGDGLVDEDWVNGRDDDGDGLIDEDFAQIGSLMYTCWFTDDQPVAQRAWPEHTPLGLKVRQEVYQWPNDIVGVRYTIDNVGIKYLQNVYVGIYADLDAGPRDVPNYYKDDEIGSWAGTWCAETGGIELSEDISTLYVHDNDTDGGRTKGYMGIVLLGTRMVFANGEEWDLGASPQAIRIFAGLLPYEDGGEPVNDFQRYETLSKHVMQPNTETPNDYKALMSVGPYDVYYGASLQIDIAFAAGEGLEGFLDNAAEAKLAWEGVWFDKDKNPLTGINGREYPYVGNKYSMEFGVSPDPCLGLPNVKVAKGDTLWINNDCYEELRMWNFPDCHKGDMLFKDFQTGTKGREAQMHWVTQMAPPPPSLRAVAGDRQVSLIWDNLSEIAPDPATGTVDFEGYRVWRADDWHRPIGTTVASGPSADLWHLLDSRDLVNRVEPNLDLKKPWREGGYQYEPLQQVKDREVLLRAFEENLSYDPLGTVPCPPGITEAERDTFEALARWNLGFDGGRQYYMYLDREVKNGLPYFYSVAAYEPLYEHDVAVGVGLADSPYSSFVYVVPRTEAADPAELAETGVYVVPNPVTRESMSPWTFSPNNADPSGEKVEFRNLPRCRSTVRIYTISGDLVQTIGHDGSGGNGTLAWNLVSRNGQTVTSGVYLFSVEPDDGRFRRFIGKFVVIR